MAKHYNAQRVMNVRKNTYFEWRYHSRFDFSDGEKLVKTEYVLHCNYVKQFMRIYAYDDTIAYAIWGRACQKAKCHRKNRWEIITIFGSVFDDSKYPVTLYLRDNGTIQFRATGINVAELNGFVFADGSISAKSSGDSMDFWELEVMSLWSQFNRGYTGNIVRNLNRNSMKVTK